MQGKHAAAKAERSRQPANRRIIMGAGDLPLRAKIKVTKAHDRHDRAACVEVAVPCSVRRCDIKRKMKNIYWQKYVKNITG